MTPLKQHHSLTESSPLPVLSVIQAPDGTPTLVFDGPDYFETLGTYPTFEAALRALKEATIILEKL